jgi:3'-phosphoadenosine 5'-phosphosulfate (PAPS) 3'-phosphatase
MKIFGIGLSKTGTTSLARALEILGYQTKDYLGVTRYSPGDLSSMDLDEINTYDAFADTPIPSFYRELDKEYPGSKFILTVRDMDGWLKSCKKQFTQKLADKQNDASISLFLDLYGCFVFDEEKFMAGYERFVNGALQYFEDRPDDLLVLDVTGGDGWDKLCSFLGAPTPDVPFPMANVTQIRWMNINDVVAIARMAWKETLPPHSKFGPTLDKEGNPGKWLSGYVKFLMGNASHFFRGGISGKRRVIANKVRKIIMKKLGGVNARIPVVSGNSRDVPYLERTTWNHLWLIDVSEENNSRLDNSDQDFVISIALIEDRRPILGVVYAPALDKVYYAEAGNNALVIERDKDPVVITHHKENDIDISPAMESKSASSVEDQKSNQAIFNTPLAMCMIAEGKSGTPPLLAGTMEWQTAGAHVVLNSSGKKVIDDNTGEELTYNKERFENAPILIS